MNNTVTRDNRFDFYKFILIVGVVWGHVINHITMDEPVSFFIHLFFRTYDMPFFMAISGYFLRSSCLKYELKDLLLNKLTMILVPSLLWSLLLSRFHSLDEYYFLNAVVFSSVIVILGHFLVLNEKIRFVLLFLISIVFYCIDALMDNMSYLYPFFVFGYAFPNVWRITEKHIPIFLIIITFIVCLCFWKSDYNIWNAGSFIIRGGWKLLIIITFRMLIAFVGMLSVKWLCDVFYNYFAKHNDRLIATFLEVGRESFSIYILHCFSFVFLAKTALILSHYFGYNIFLFNTSFGGYVIAPFIASLIIYVVMLISKLLKKNKYSNALLGFKVSDFKVK